MVERSSRTARLLVIAVAVTVAVPLAVPAAAAPDTSRLEQLEQDLDQQRGEVLDRRDAVEGLGDRARALRDDEARNRARLEEIEAELSLAVERYNQAAVALEDVQAEVHVTRDELSSLNAEVDELEVAIEDHARRLHKLGPSVEFASLLASSSPGEFGFKSTHLRLILNGEHAGLQAFGASRDRVSALLQRLAEQEARADAAAADVEAELVEVEATHEEHEAELEVLTAALDEAEREHDRQRSALADDEQELELQRDAVESERARLEREQRELEEQRRREAEAERRAARQEERQRAAPQPAPSVESPNHGGTSDDSSSGSTGGPRRSAKVAVDTALAQVGKPYVWGATGPDSFDCSGLTSYAWRAAGVTIPRTSGAQLAGLRKVSRSELQPGDLVFYNSPISHVAMYVGGDTIVEASRSGIPVRTAKLSRRTPVGYSRP